VTASRHGATPITGPVIHHSRGLNYPTTKMAHLAVPNPRRHWRQDRTFGSSTRPVHKRTVDGTRPPLPSTTQREQYQRFTRLSTTTSDPDNDLAVKWSGCPARVCKDPTNKPSDDAWSALRLSCRGGADGPTKVPVSYTGTTTLTFTATADQPLDGGGFGLNPREGHAGRDPVSGWVQLKNDI